MYPEDIACICGHFKFPK